MSCCVSAVFIAWVVSDSSTRCLCSSFASKSWCQRWTRRWRGESGSISSSSAPPKWSVLVTPLTPPGYWTGSGPLKHFICTWEI